MTRNREIVLAAITGMAIVGIVGAWWHVTGGCGPADLEKPFAACRRVEDNQGVISVGALVAALYFFWAENRRANRAEAEIVRRGVEQESKDRIAEALARHQARAERALERARDIFEFDRSINLLMVTLADDVERLSQVMHGPNGHSVVASITEPVRSSAKEAIELVAPAAPLDGEYRLALQRLRMHLGRKIHGAGEEGALQTQGWLQRLVDTVRELEERRSFLIDIILTPVGLDQTALTRW